MKLNMEHITDKFINFTNKIKKPTFYNDESLVMNKKKSNFIVRCLKKHSYMVIPIIILMCFVPFMSYILGVEYSAGSIKNVPTIIVNNDNSTTTQNLVDMIKNNDIFNVIAYSSNDDDIKNYIDSGKAMVGVLIPSDFSDDLLNGKSAKIMTFYDDTQSTPTTSAKSAVSEVLSTIKTGYLIKLAEGKLGASPEVATSIVAPMGFKYRLIGNPTKNTSYFMVEGVALTLLQISSATVGAAISEKENYLKLVLKGLIIGILASISGFFCVYIQIKLFNTPYRGSIFAGGMLTFLCCTGWTFFGIFINLAKKGNKPKAIMSTSAISTTMVLSGYTYPVIAMPKIFSTISELTPNTHFITPLRDISLLGSTFGEVLRHIIWLSKFALLMIGIATIKFLLSKKAKRKAEKKNVDDKEKVEYEDKEVTV